MTRYPNDIGVQVPTVLLPPATTDFSKWAVVACDQFTSQPEYWEEAAHMVGDAPSTLNLILQEAYLGKPEEAARMQTIRSYMERYLEQGVLQAQEQGFVLVRRQAEGKERVGLVMALDLEQYDYHKGATTLIRATEGTVLDRIPPRLRIRKNAIVELPHILVLIDDPGRTVIEPLTQRQADFPLLYDTDLMLGGGHVEGRLVSNPEAIQSVLSALTALTDPAAFAAKYGQGIAPLLFAMGDGNHSFATAKAAWEEIKSTLPQSQWEDCPARYALVEVENVHDAGIVFEPIHRVLFHVDPEKALERLNQLLNQQNGGCSMELYAHRQALESAQAEGEAQSAFVLPFFFGSKCGAFFITSPAQQLPVGTLQAAIDALLQEYAGAEVDYIHGEDVVLELSGKKDAVGFLLPGMKKEELFPTVVFDGALPRKTFSMGEACEKRNYMECRKIQ